jgi:hypothetical protein
LGWVIESLLTEVINPLDIIKDGISAFTADNVSEDIEHLIPLFDKTIKDVTAIVELCAEGASLDPSLTFDESLKNRSIIQSKYQETYQMFLMHVVQSVHLTYEMQYAIKEKSLHDWYAYIGDLASVCLQSLLKAKGDLIGQVSTGSTN